MIKNLILTISLICLIISCSNRITGFYYNKDFNKYTPDYCYISICADSVYYMAYNDILGEANYKGTWTRLADTLFLKIPKPCRTRNSKLIEKQNTLIDYKRVECKLLSSCGDTMSLIYDTLIINDRYKFAIDSMGTVKVTINKIDKIEIKGVFYNYLADTIFYPQDFKSNDFILYVGETDEMQDATCGLIWRKFFIDKRRLKIIDKNSNIDSSDFYFKRHRRCIR